MKELYNLTAAEVINDLAKEVMDIHHGLSKSMAKKLVLNALIYNCVIEEVMGQVAFLMGSDEWADE